jgi:hypothetical protein
MINLGYKFNRDIYSHEDIELLNTLANQTAIAIENARLYEDLTPPPAGNTSPGAKGLAGDASAQAWGGRLAGSGRPTKRERRLTDLLKGGED